MTASFQIHSPILPLAASLASDSAVLPHEREQELRRFTHEELLSVSERLQLVSTDLITID
jgi:hypothetical protein